MTFPLKTIRKVSNVGERVSFRFDALLFNPKLKLFWSVVIKNQSETKVEQLGQLIQPSEKKNGSYDPDCEILFHIISKCTYHWKCHEYLKSFVTHLKIKEKKTCDKKKKVHLKSCIKRIRKKHTMSPTQAQFQASKPFLCTFLVSLWHHILLKSSKTTSYITHLHFNSTSYQSHIKNANYTWDHTGSLVKLNVKMMSAKRSSNNNNRVLTPSSPLWYKTKPRKCSRRKLEFFYTFFFVLRSSTWCDMIFFSLNHLPSIIWCVYCVSIFTPFSFFFSLSTQKYMYVLHTITSCIWCEDMSKEKKVNMWEYTFLMQD